LIYHYNTIASILPSDTHFYVQEDRNDITTALHWHAYQKAGIYHHQVLEWIQIQIQYAIDNNILHETHHREMITIEYLHCIDCMHQHHERKKTEMQEETSRQNIRRAFIDQLLLIRSRPLVEYEEWSRADYEIEQLISHGIIIQQHQDGCNDILKDQILQQARYNMASMINERQQLLCIWHKDLQNTIDHTQLKETTQKQIRLTRLEKRRRIQVIKEKIDDIKQDTPMAPKHIQYRHKITLQDPAMIHDLQLNTCIHPLNLQALKINCDAIYHHTTYHNKATKLFEHPIHGILLLRLQYPIIFTCAHTLRRTKVPPCVHCIYNPIQALFLLSMVQHNTSLQGSHLLIHRRVHHTLPQR